MEASLVCHPDYADLSVKRIQLLKKRGEYLGHDASNVAIDRRVVLCGIGLEQWGVHFPLEIMSTPLKLDVAHQHTENKELNSIIIHKAPWHLSHIQNLHAGDSERVNIDFRRQVTKPFHYLGRLPA